MDEYKFRYMKIILSDLYLKKYYLIIMACCYKHGGTRETRLKVLITAVSQTTTPYILLWNSMIDVKDLMAFFEYLLSLWRVPHAVS